MEQEREALRERLGQAFAYALEHDTFSKAGIVRRAENVCIYGLGKYFDEAFQRQNIGARFGVTHLCDGNARRREEISQDVRYAGYHCIAPEEIAELPNAAVIFMLGDPRQAMKAIKQYFSKEEWYRLITFNDLILDDVMKAEDECIQGGDKQSLLAAYDMMEDIDSCRVFANVFCLRVAPHLADREYEEMCVLPQYFPADIMKLTQAESVVDCGAYIGDTLQEFTGIVGGHFARYHAFELDEENYHLLCNKASEIDEKRIACHHYGVWNENKSIEYGRMSSEDSYSIFNGSETCQAEVVCLDDFLAGEQVTLIKMDIEGAEMMALHGYKSIISKQKPKLAICVYHRVRDLWEIPLYMRRIRADYKLYMRHHAKFWVSETVCYAI